jgi:NADH dehydrogenase
MSKRWKVIIVGGGFGGLYAAQRLKSAPVDVTLFDRCNYHLFQPLLYQVATGSLSPSHIAAPLRSILRRQTNTRVLLGEVVDIDPIAKCVLLADGVSCGYDVLIVATGSRSFYFGQDRWREWALSLKSVEEALAIRHKILYAFEAAERISDPQERRAWLSFVIVGAGATGVELAGALAEMARYTLQEDFRSIRSEEAQIILVDGAPRVLPGFPADLSAKAERSLHRLGVQVRTSVHVRSLDREGVSVETPDGSERWAARTVVWAGGVVASELGRTLARRTGAETDKAGRIRVNPDLTVPNYPAIYVAGDLALVFRPDGRPLPGMAPVAMQEGAYVAKAIVKRLNGVRELPPFRYHDKGNMAVIGRAAAVADIFGRHIWGLPAWLIWLFVHLMYLVEFRSRVLVFIQWGFEYVTFRRGARLMACSAAATVIQGTSSPMHTADRRQPSTPRD